jgi:hypothetical protein
MTAIAETVQELSGDRGQVPNSAPNLQGYIDAIEPDRIYGWAWNSGDASERLIIEVRQGEQLIVRLAADQPRPDLVANGIGDGRYAFVANIAAIGEIDRASPVSVIAMTPDGDATLELKRQNAPLSAGNVNATVIGEIRARDQRLQGQLRQLVTVAKERGGLDQELYTRLSDCLDRFDAFAPELDRRVGALEVFELRFDTLLHKVDKRIGSMEAMLRPRRPWLLWLWSILASALAVGLVVHNVMLRGG